MIFKNKLKIDLINSKLKEIIKDIDFSQNYDEY